MTNTAAVNALEAAGYGGRAKAAWAAKCAEPKMSLAQTKAVVDAAWAHHAGR